VRARVCECDIQLPSYKIIMMLEDENLYLSIYISLIMIDTIESFLYKLQIIARTFRYEIELCGKLF
jgi:hypothetical protein